MGSVLKESDKKIKKKVSIYSLLLAPVILVGLGLLGMQTYGLFTGKSLKEINFDIGSLWNSEPSQVDLPIEVDDIILKVEHDHLIYPNTEKEVIKPQFTSTRYVQPRRTTQLVDPGMNSRPESMMQLQFQPFERTNLKSIPLHSTIPLVRNYMSLAERDYLINPNIKEEKGRFFIGLSFAPSFNFRKFQYRNTSITGSKTVDNTRYTFGMTEKYRNLTDRAISSYYAGLDFGINISDKFSVSSGFYYSVYGEQISVTTIETNDINSRDASFLDQTPLYCSPENSEKPTNLTYDNRYSYIEVPVSVTIQMLDLNKLNLGIQAGVFGSILDHSNALIYDFETDYYYWLNSTDYEVYRKFGFGVSSGVVVSQFVGSKLEVFANPQFKYNLNSTFKEPYPVDQHQYSTGIRLGFIKHLDH